MKFDFSPYDYVFRDPAGPPLPMVAPSALEVVPAYSAEREHRVRMSLRYGTNHRRRRAQEARSVAAGEASCARCGRPIAPTDAWHLDHADDGDPERYLGPSHAACNARASNVGRSSSSSST